MFDTVASWDSLHGTRWVPFLALAKYDALADTAIWHRRWVLRSPGCGTIRTHPDGAACQAGISVARSHHLARASGGGAAPAAHYGVPLITWKRRTPEDIATRRPSSSPIQSPGYLPAGRHRTEALGPPLQDPVPVHPRQYQLLQQVHASPLLRLVEGERLLRLQVIVELRKHQPPVARNQRA